MTTIPSPTPTIQIKEELAILKKAPLQDRKDQILHDIHAIIFTPFETANVTKDLQRLINSVIFLKEESENVFSQVPFLSNDLKLENASISQIFVDFFNFLVKFISHTPKDTVSLVSRWLEIVGMGKYRDSFQSCRYTDLNALIQIGLDKNDFSYLQIDDIVDQKTLKFALSCLTAKNIPFHYQFFPISLDEFVRNVILNDPHTLKSFITQRFSGKPQILQVCSCFHQAIVVSFLGHLGESLFYSSGYRFKDIKGSWNVLISHHQGFDRTGSIPYISVTHKRSEMVLETKRMTEIFSFEWEIQLQFTNLEMNDLHCIKARIIQCDWSNSPKKDIPQEEKEILEKHLTCIFHTLDIPNTLFKKDPQSISQLISPRNQSEKLQISEKQGKKKNGFFDSVAEEEIEISK